MTKRYQGPITRMYVTIVALILVVSLTGFVKNGKTVVIELDGAKQIVYTYAIKKDALLREQNILLGPYDEAELSTPNLEDGTTITVRRAVPVTLVCRDQVKQVMTAKKTVWEVAEQYGYSRKHYRPYGNPQQAVVKGMTITVGSFSEKEIQEDEIVPFAVENIPDETLLKGQEKQIQLGQNGVKKVTIKTITMEGNVVSREVVKTKVVTEMKPLIRRVGTKQAIHTGAGNISAYTKRISMKATAYLPTDGNGKGLTRMGTRARRGVVAVDPRVIPLGTKVYVPGYGVAVAEDTGGAILGNRIDLCMETYNECRTFGRRNVSVYILK